ncbi:MAG TPA: serine/threonine-protein kinase [Verrucomicrobiota bacterium]|nr:serine/threonine-protein kinase [Verrucomicrobiota bacterium]HRZ38989.1 serine/threonine-protein kinase [Candidatus Paceibacterota bacterium]
METTHICSGCGKPLAPNAPQGLCPQCLLKAGLGSGVDIGPDTQSGSGGLAFVAPALDEIARLFPQLEILGFVGQGGMGAVYRARQKELDRVVALKILPPDIGRDAAFAERFTREARAMAKLNHPGIVTLYEFGRADGLFFFLMEFVEGVNLGQLLEGGHISSREALALVPQICDALQYAHDQGIVHRDIKPQNILVDRRGRVKVADFGLAKLVATGSGGEPVSPTGAAAAASPLTETGKVMGTPQYMAPEQREHPTEVDHRADIYSLGVVFYQMLTGELPGKPVEAPSSRLRGMQIDVRLDEIVLRAMEREPERRYQQASQVKADVETIASSPPPPGPAPRPNRWEVGIIASALTVYAFLLVLIPTVSPPFRHLLAFLCLVGLSICGLTLAGWWPAPSFLVPDSGFSRRNLHRVGTLSRFAFICAGLSVLIPVLCWLVPWLFPRLSLRGQEWMLWLGLSAAFMAVAAGIGARQTGLGKTALVVGIINASLWLLFAVAGSSSVKPFANGKGPRATASAPDSVLILRDNLALDLDGQSLVDVSRQSRRVPAQLQAVDVVWDNDGGGVLMRNPRGTSRLLPLPDASDFEHAAALAVQRRELVEGSEDRGGLASKCRFFAVLSDQDRLAVIEIKEFDPMQATVRWRFVQGPKTAPGTVQPANPSASSFGPVIERTLNDLDERRGDEAFTQAKPGEFKVTLENGLTLEVVAVGRDPRGSNSWWQPDGTPLAEPPVDILELPKLAPTRQSQVTVIPQNEFLFYIRRAVPSGMVIESFQPRFTPRPSDVEIPATVLEIGSTTRASAQLVCFAEPPDTADYQEYVACGPWEAVSVYDAKTKTTRDLERGVMALWSEPRYEQGALRFDVMHNADRERFALRMVARLQNGGSEKLVFHSGVLTGAPAKGFALVHGTEHRVENWLRQVKEMVIERTPWVRGQVRNIRLRPREFTAAPAAEAAPEQDRVAFTNGLGEVIGLVPAPGITRKTAASLSEADRARAVALFNDIEDFGHEFEAAFASTNLAAAQTGVRRLLTMLANFNAVVRGTDCEFPAALLDDIGKVQRALTQGDWESARRLARHDETYAREFRRIGAAMAALARETQASSPEGATPEVNRP